LDENFGGMSGLFAASQQHQFESLQYEVEQMRLRPEIAGFVVTEFTDIYWECNGLLDLHRRPKAGHHGYQWIFGHDLPIGQPDRRRCFIGEQIKVQLHAAHASSQDLTRGTLHWSLSDGSLRGEHPLAIDAWSVSKVAEIALELTVPGRHRLELELEDAQGALAGRNWIDLRAFEPPHAEISAWSGDANVRDFLEAAGVPIDRELGVHVHQGLEATGERAVLLASEGDERAGVKATARNGTLWEGDWAQGMHWVGATLRRGTPLSPRLDLTCSGLVPESVLEGADLDHSLAGMYVGWIHNAVATAAVLRPGVVATTFPIIDAGPHDPLGVWLLTNLLREASRS
jgi:hypothetical protein